MDSQYMQSHTAKHKKKEIRNETTQKKWSTAQKNVCFIPLHEHVLCRACHTRTRRFDEKPSPNSRLVSWCPLQASIAHKNKANGTAGNAKLITGLSSICPNGLNVSTPKLWAQVKNFLSPRITSTWSSLAPLFLVFQDAPFSGEV